MINVWGDLETRSAVPIRDGTHRYAESCRVMLWAYAVGDGEIRVWDLLNGTDNHEDEMSGLWVEEPAGKVTPPPGLWDGAILREDTLFWFHNGGMFDFPVIDRQLAYLGQSMPHERRRDTMVQAYCHALPGALDKLGTILKLTDAQSKLKDEGRKYINLFCKPKADGTFNDKASHPVEWQGFIRYAARDITTMRAAHRIMPKWNYSDDKQIGLWQRHLAMTCRGMFVDQELATKAIAAADRAKALLAKRTTVITDGAVTAATQRDKLLAYILAEHGVELPDMQADTLTRRLEDPELPEAVKELLRIRLQSSMNSSSKYRTVGKAVNRDGRLRGCSQFRGAGRTGRTAHRLFQPGNLPRPAYSYPYIEAGIAAIKAECLGMVVGDEMKMLGSAVRGVIIAPPDKVLLVGDLANIEGRVAAWLAGEDWKLQAYRDYDTIIGEDDKGKPLRLGPDLYVVAYCSAFNVDQLSDDEHEAFLQRQIGKVQELMLQFEGGVGAWITGAATYGIDLDAMTEAVYPTLPADVVKEAESFLQWCYDTIRAEMVAKLEKAARKHEFTDAEKAEARALAEAALPEMFEKARFGLDERVFVTCDSLKRLWRRRHPRIASYWRELKDKVIEAIQHPGVTLTARKLRVRRDGSWLRIRLPSGRFLCYPSIRLTKDGTIAYTGSDPYTKQWKEIRTYGGKIFENVVQAVANDQFMEPLPAIEAAGFEPVLDVHDEWVCEGDPSLKIETLCEIMVMDLGWNEGLPLAAAGDVMTTYHKT